MSELTNEEKKWFESLKRCLKKKPKGVEVLIQEFVNSESEIGSSIHLFKKGEIYKSQTDVDDLMSYTPDSFSLESFLQDGVTGNNHGY